MNLFCKLGLAALAGAAVLLGINRAEKCNVTLVKIPVKILVKILVKPPKILVKRLLLRLRNIPLRLTKTVVAQSLMLNMQ
jgi:hypothetical protein